MTGATHDRIVASPEELPKWFVEKVSRFRDASFFQHPEAVAAYLNHAQQSVYETYARFNANAQPVFLFALGSVGVAVALLGFGPEQNTREVRGGLLLGAGVALFSFVPLVYFALRNQKERYRTYVAAVLHAAYCHYAAGVPCHPWFDWLESYVGKSEVTDERSFIDYWINTPPNSFLPYKRAVLLLTVAVSLVGALLVGLGVTEWFGISLLQ